MENNCNIIYEGEQLLIHLVRPTTKEEKITQYDVIHTRLYLFNPFSTNLTKWSNTLKQSVGNSLVTSPICWVGA